MNTTKKLLFTFLLKYGYIQKGDMGDFVISINKDGVTDFKWNSHKPVRYNALVDNLRAMGAIEEI